MVDREHQVEFLLEELLALEASLVSHDESSTEQFVFIEVGDGRLFVIVTDCALEDAADYWPWFHAALGSLEIWPAPEGG